VNGASGFDPPFTQDIRMALFRLPATGELTDIRSIYPLRYLLVHLNLLQQSAERESWERFGQAPPGGLRLVGRMGDTLTFEVTSEPERSRHWERTFSRDIVMAHPRAHVDVAVLPADPEIESTVNIDFNGRRLSQSALTATPVDLDLPLPPPYPQVDRNLLTLAPTYRLRPHVSDAPAYLVGGTGVRSPVDLVVTSAGKEHGWVASIRVNDTEMAPDRRDYNVVVVDPRSGRVEERESFDTFLDRAESARLAEFIARLPAGSIVAAASWTTASGS
jgi:Interleukin-like EMT inducer